ncbi:MAG: hypothetical protein IJS29_07325 [Selenomonadaceae bacterium]|nr:hypothetical protein [Selenomonadaceae bacterium]
MDDAELDGVAGGTVNEVLDDREMLKKIGVYDFNSKDGFTKSVQNAFAKFGNEYGLKISVDIGLNAETANKYSVNGKAISRDELYSLMNEVAAANKK